ncbi:hypothetical protein CERSUDRAFT_72167 [Gelatoporia subvermispora B]|uniref:Uncharacterized protein n=1 Tax=Ceriporiopsis subvermispora (strain B) TaxID=914234 RepID=M2QPC9_CERS8|nr:hypothetical protein CERSUDRAFT_72167 [Gelatoporia subvermispora B]
MQQLMWHATRPNHLVSQEIALAPPLVWSSPPSTPDRQLGEWDWMHWPQCWDAAHPYRAFAYQYPKTQEYTWLTATLQRHLVNLRVYNYYVALEDALLLGHLAEPLPLSLLVGVWVNNSDVKVLKS